MPNLPNSRVASHYAETNGGEALVAGLVETAGSEASPLDAEVLEVYRRDLGDEVFEETQALAAHLISRKAAIGQLQEVADRLLLVGVVTVEDLEALLALR